MSPSSRSAAGAPFGGGGTLLWVFGEAIFYQWYLSRKNFRSPYFVNFSRSLKEYKICFKIVK
jgi:hypothetical protein